MVGLLNPWPSLNKTKRYKATKPTMKKWIKVNNVIDIPRTEEDIVLAWDSNVVQKLVNVNQIRTIFGTNRSFVKY